MQCPDGTIQDCNGFGLLFEMNLIIEIKDEHGWPLAQCHNGSWLGDTGVFEQAIHLMVTSFTDLKRKQLHALTFPGVDK